MEQSSCGFLFVRHVNGSFHMTMNTSQSNMLKPNKVKKEMDVFSKAKENRTFFPTRLTCWNLRIKPLEVRKIIIFQTIMASRISFLRLWHPHLCRVGCLGQYPNTPGPGMRMFSWFFEGGPEIWNMSIDMFQNLGTYQKGTVDIRYHRFFLATVYSCNHEFLSVFCSYIYIYFFFFFGGWFSWEMLQFYIQNIMKFQEMLGWRFGSCLSHILTKQKNAWEKKTYLKPSNMIQILY